MARVNDLEVDKILIWHTELPYEGEPRTSPVFSFMGSDWCLRFRYRDSVGDYHVVTLHQVRDGQVLETAENEQPFDVKAYMMPVTGNDDVEIAAMRRSFDSSSTHVWYSVGKNKEIIFKTLGWLYDRPEVKLACKFNCWPPSTCQLKIGRDHLLPVVHQKSTLTTEDKSVQVSSEVPRDIELLTSDFSRLLDKEILPDVKLKCRDRTIRAHRSILAARSDVFRAMFQNETLESETGDVTIQDMEVGVLEKLLEFVYTGRPDELSEDCTSDLYEAADKYAVLSLKAACSYWIERHLAVENCVRYLRVADSHCDRDLKAAVISFIVENPEVLKSDCWLALSKELPVLANEVFQTYVASMVK